MQVGVDIVTAMEGLERFIRTVAAKPEDNEQNVDTPPTAPEQPEPISTASPSDMPDIPACLDRRPKAQAIAVADKAKTEAA
jgi:hypothetical protein